MSITLRWRILLIFIALILVTGGVVVRLLSLGLTDPPRAGSLQWRAESPDGWDTHSLADLTVYAAPVRLPDTVTIELAARNDGPPDSAWGIRLRNGEKSLTILLDNQGYYAVSSSNEPRWTEFLHSRAAKTNRLYLHIDPDGMATLRINDEIAWAGRIGPTTGWKIVSFHQPQLAWHNIALYYQ